MKRYLEALEQHRPRRGRKRTPESINKRLEAIEQELATADPVTRLNLVQERLDLNAELKRMEDVVDLSEVEKDFIAAAKSYSERRGISYQAWREIGVPASVLKEAGISRSS